MKEIIITASVLILCVMLIRHFFKGKISNRLQYALWLLVAEFIFMVKLTGCSRRSVISPKSPSSLLTRSMAAAVLSKRDCELACDEGALLLLGEQERIGYGKTLLSIEAT